jgi:thymidine kinase
MFAHCLNQGWVEIIVGCMFSGKTEEFIRRVRRAELAKQKLLVFKHSWDSRYQERDIASHAGTIFDAYPAESVEDIKKILEDKKDVKIVAIDEVQFFSEDIIPFVEELANSGKRVILAGLDQDFKGDPFNVVMKLLVKAELIEKLHAICTLCGSPASKTQRIINGKPAKATDSIILVGASECYEARCRKCHVVSS